MSWSTVGTFVGYAVGTYFGYPQLGAVVGGMVGGQVDMANMPTSKLEDLSATKVNLGASISKAYGHPRLGGNIVWCSDAIPSGKVGGAKGGDGGGQETYVRHVIYLLGEDDNGFPARWWAGGKLVINRLSSASDETIDASVEESMIREIIYHPGSPSQLPFATYATIVGDEFAIAYRGRGTAFLTVDCGTSGQLPPMTFELAGKDSGENSGRTARIKKDWAQADYRGDPPEGSSMGGLHVIGVQGDSVQTFRDGDTTQSNSLPEGVPLGLEASGSGDKALAVWGHPWGTCNLAWAGSGYSVRIECDDPHDYLGSQELRFCTFNGQIVFATSLQYGFGADSYSGADGTKGKAYIYALDGTLVHQHQFYPTVSSAQSVAMNDDALWIFDGTDIYEYSREDYLLKATIPAPDGTAHRILISQEGALCCANYSAQVYRWEMGETEMEWKLLASLDDAMNEEIVPPAPYPAEYLGTENAHHMVRGANVYAVIRKEKTEVEITNYPYFVNPAWSGGTISPVYGYPSAEIINSLFAYTRGAVHQCTGAPLGWGQSFFFPLPSCIKRESFFKKWVLLSEEPFPDPESDSRLLVYEHFAERRYYPDADFPPYGMFETSTTVNIVKAYATITDEDPRKYVDVYRKRLDIDVYDLTEPTLQQVVEDLAIRAGLDLASVDAEQLASENVHAFAVTQVGPTSSALELLMAVYRFYCVESEGRLKFRFLGHESIRTISFSDLGATFGEAPANPLPMMRGSELELPSMESVRYSNISNDYQDGLESSDRLLQSIQSSRTSEYAIGLYPDEAKQLAVISQQVAQAGIVRVGPFNLGPEHRDLEPGDVITVIMQDGGSIQVLMTRVRYDRGVLEIEGVSYDAAAYLSDATTANNYTPAVTVRRPPDTEALVFDPPLLTDDMDGPKFAVVAKPSRFPWPGYSFQRSPDNNTFTELYQDNKFAIFGTCSTTLAAWTGGRVVDWVSTLTVDVGAGQLASITRSELLSSRLNLAMVGAELLQFQRAELVATGVYILSGFVRYLSGTEWVVHASGEDFVLVEPSKISAVGLNLADRGVSRFYKAVTRGRNMDTAETMEFTPDLVSMKPIAPANVRSVILPNGDVLLRWVRRTRYQTNVLRGVVPLGEASESYTVDVYDDTMLLRTITASTTEATYTSAQQSADGVASYGIRFVIRQVGQVEGYPAELEI